MSLPYTGKDNLYTVDGTPLPITKSGQSVAKIDGSSCVLRDLFLVPSATRNLISVNRLCRDNNVSVSFDAQRVRIYDLATKAIILEGGVRGGLYELPMRTKLRGGSVNVCEKLDHFRWHCRLGHLNFKYMSTLEKKGVIKSNSKSLIHCNSCQLGKSHDHMLFLAPPVNRLTSRDVSGIF